MEKEEKDIKEEGIQLPNEGAEETPTEGAETPPAPTARQKALERLRKRKEGRDFADDDDEAVFGAINEDADEDEAELSGYKENAQRMNDLLGSDWRAASLFDSWGENGSPTFALVEEFGEDIVADCLNPDNKEKIKQAETKRLEKLAKEKELNDEYERNSEESNALIESLINDGKYTQEQIDEAVETLKQSFMNFLVGKIDEDMIARAIKANNYDADKEKAAAQGEIKGRNANISQTLNKRKEATDGIPSLGGSGKTSQEPVKPAAKPKPNVWGD